MDEITDIVDPHATCRSDINSGKFFLCMYMQFAITTLYLGASVYELYSRQKIT